jgi:hypothetical protein
MSEIGTKPRSSRRLTWSVGLLALVMSVMTVFQVHHFGESRPTARDDMAGRTHAVKIHERTVYLTTGEFASAVGSHVIAIAAIGVFLGLLLKSRRAKA